MRKKLVVAVQAVRRGVCEVAIGSDLRRKKLALAVAFTTASLTAQGQVGGTTHVPAGERSALGSVLRVVAVPWQGNPNNEHVVYSGGSLVLQAVAYPDTGAALQSATWDPGDGSPPVSVSIADPRILELTHAYSGTVGEPYVARIEVVDVNNNRATDTFRVRIHERTLPVEVNMAIDRGLWHLHKRQQRTTSNGVDVGHWTNGVSRAAATASALLAYQVHGHLEKADREEDPYVDDVARGLAGLMLDLRAIPISMQGPNNPDTNGNGLGIETVDARRIYVVGQVVDALVATQTPDLLTRTGGTNILGRRYLDIVIDCMDAYYWGQVDAGQPRGGWRYHWNRGTGAESGSDNSASQWYAIGGIAVERAPGFVGSIPQFVREENRIWLTTSRRADGRFGYTSSDACAGAWDDCVGTTASGLIQMVADQQVRTTPEWITSERFLATNFALLTSRNSIYGMFALAKAMRYALPGAVNLLDGTLDWYADPARGLAQHLVRIQQSDGSWDSGNSNVADDVASAWALVILSSSIIEIAPIAVCRASLRTAPINTPIDLDGRASRHPDAPHTIVGWEWDFDCNGTVDATGPTATHPGFATVGEKCVRLIVFDERDPPVRSAPNDCIIRVTPPPFPPTAQPGGPYILCLGSNQRLVLDGSGSQDPDGFIVQWAWDYRPQPLDRSFDDSFGVTTDVTAYFAGLQPGHYDIGLRVTDDSNLTDTAYTTVTVYAPGNCPTSPPEFTPRTPCGRVVMATAGAPLDIEVCATDRDLFDVVTLDVVGSLPPGAAMAPALPVRGNPVCSRLQWTPALNQVGRYRVTFSAVDTTNQRAECGFDIEVAECFLMLGSALGDDRVNAGTHVFSTGLRGVTAIHPVTRTSLPLVLAAPLVFRAAPPNGGSLPPGREFIATAQVFMWNPQMFPTNPEQASDVLELWMAGGVIEVTRSGQSDGMSIGVRSQVVNGRTYMQFPFTINGM